MGDEMNKLWKRIEQDIQEKYSLDSEREWVEVNISPKGKIHVTIVSDKEIDRFTIEEMIHDKIKLERELYRIGFINIYTIHQAEELCLEKKKKKENYISWAEALYSVGEDVSEKKDTQIISFYSYKGGVGRTIALLETAYNLADAGKRVLMLDLDIEAPSLHKIFAEDILGENSEVEFGIVDYLYKTVLQKVPAKEEDIDKMICPLNVDGIFGEMFLIPALKEMNSEYVYQIGRLQTEQIHEQNAFEKVITYVCDKYQIDVMLIDTRAGFNPWGSLSLLSLSNQIIFVAYPNEENIEGLNVALQVLQNVGKKHYAVAMSKIVATEEGANKAKRLFEKLNVNQEELIPIYYSEEIAISNKYPITSENTVRAYKKISDYILDNERIEQNKAFLSNGIKEQVLENVFLDVMKKVPLANVQRFAETRINGVLLYQSEDEIYSIVERKNNTFTAKNDNFWIIPSYRLRNDELSMFYAELLADNEKDIVEIGIQLVVKNIINSSFKDLLSSEIENITWEEILEGLMFEPEQDIFGVVTKEEMKDAVYVSKDISIFINVTEEVIGISPESVAENIRKIMNTFSKENIHFKFMISAELWRKHQDNFSGMRSLITEVKVEKRDIEGFLYENVNKEVKELYEDYLEIKNPIRELDDMQKKDLLSLVFGVRKNIKVYSGSIIDYLYEWTINNPTKKYEYLLDILKEVAKEELINPSEEYTDRLLSFDKIRTKLETSN